jgi:hypothetical protein
MKKFHQLMMTLLLQYQLFHSVDVFGIKRHYSKMKLILTKSDSIKFLQKEQLFYLKEIISLSQDFLLKDNSVSERKKMLNF